jgi:hypothetical protein
MTDPPRPPPGFIVWASQAFSAEGNERYERAATMLLRNLAAHRVGGPIMALATRFRPLHIHVQPDRAACGQWTRNAHAQPHAVSGTDLGARVLFTPRCWQFGGIFDARSVLLHEIVHAIRHLTRSWTGAAAPRGYPNIEEFHAVTIANVLQSALGLPLRLGYTFGDPAYAQLIRMVSPQVAAGPQGGFGMRGAAAPSNHTAEQVVTPTRVQLITFSGMFAQAHSAVQALSQETPMLTEALAPLPSSIAPFNPYRR